MKKVVRTIFYVIAGLGLCAFGLFGWPLYLIIWLDKYAFNETMNPNLGIAAGMFLEITYLLCAAYLLYYLAN